MSHSGRVHLADQRFNADVSDADFTNHVFLRLVAKGKRFVNVDFKYSHFDTCYLRNCVFDTCDFTGCRFIGTNLHASRFSGCKFDYAVFERTLIESDVLDTECPGPDNLKMRFARTLRMNYQQLGDARSANKAIGVELGATKVHLCKSWRSNESYYRKKYSGWKRLRAFVEWLHFEILDAVWGNGENTLKLLRSTVVILLVMSVIDVLKFRDAHRIDSYMEALLNAPQVFLGTFAPKNYPLWYLTLILCVRLVTFGFFMSIVIKRFNRR
jgi:hypothetical protein